MYPRNQWCLIENLFVHFWVRKYSFRLYWTRDARTCSVLSAVLRSTLCILYVSSQCDKYASTNIATHRTYKESRNEIVPDLYQNACRRFSHPLISLQARDQCLSGLPPQINNTHLNLEFAIGCHTNAMTAFDVHSNTHKNSCMLGRDKGRLLISIKFK